MEYDHQPTTTERLTKIAESPVQANITNEGQEQVVDLSLPFGCGVEGRLVEDAEGRKKMHVSSFLRVPAELRGHAIGERLMRGLTVVAKEEGADILASNIGSPYALAIRRRIFGDEALDFVDTSGNVYDVTAEEAMEVLQEIYDDEPDAENPAEGIDVEVDLSRVNIDEWEKPLRG